MSRTVLPFGPQHPVLPEPLHLKLTLEDEIVKEAVPNLGYVHRGLERMTDIRDFHQMIRVTERVCGICSFIHALCYCQGLEDMMEVEIPPRAKYLRVMWSELHRIHSHLLWLGLFADAFGFESLFMQFWRIREKTMDMDEMTTGNRVILGANAVGGVRFDIDDAMAKTILATLDEVEAEVKKLQKTMMDDYTVRKRTVGIGMMTKDEAYALGAAGPTLRGSGVKSDMRMTGYAAYGDIGFEPITDDGGDCYARTKVRFLETLQAAELCRRAIKNMPAGDIAAKIKGNPKGEVVSRVEQPRGELFYYLKGNGTKNLERCRIRTPTFANVPPLLHMLPGCELADVPVIALTIDPCISCTER